MTLQPVDRTSAPAAIVISGPWRGSAWRTQPKKQSPLSKTFAQGQEIFSDGDRAETIYKVVAGVVRTCRFLNDGRRQIEAFYRAGDLFGLEPGAERTLSAEAVSECTVLVFRHRSSGESELFDQHAPVELLEIAMADLERSRSHALLLSRRSATERVASFLLGWADRSSGHAVLALPMSRQDIADYLGLTIETVSRTITQLERDKIIELDAARRIRILKNDALEQAVA